MTEFATWILVMLVTTCSTQDIKGKERRTTCNEQTQTYYGLPSENACNSTAESLMLLYRKSKAHCFGVR